jgi:hypothetical protein
MQDKEKLLLSCQEFLRQYQTNPTRLKNKDYRQFFGTIRETKEWLKRKAFSKEQLKILQQAAQLLQNLLNKHQNNYSAIGTTEKNLKELSQEFNDCLKPTNLPETKSKLPDCSDWNEKLTQAEKGLEWLNWWEKHQTAIKFAATIISLLFLWLVLEKIKEKLH